MVDALSADWDDAASGASTVHGSFSHQTEDATMPAIDSNNTALDSANTGYLSHVGSGHNPRLPTTSSSSSTHSVSTSESDKHKLAFGERLMHLDWDVGFLITNSRQLSGQVPLLH